MLRILLGTDWVSGRDQMLSRIAGRVGQRQPGQILLVPELISHDMERRLCAAAGDTASRYAEVLTFTRLVDRVAEANGTWPGECLDQGGRIVAMAAAVHQLSGRLKAYAAIETKPEFLMELVRGVDELKCCRISAAALMEVSGRTRGSLAQKLEELALLLQGYDAICARGKRDPRDQMDWLLEELEVGAFAQTHTFYIDGFPDFTMQHLAILDCLIRLAPEVTISLTCDQPASRAVAFEKVGQTAAQLLRLAQRAGIETAIERLPQRQDGLTGLRQRIFQGPLDEAPWKDRVELLRTDTPYTECVAVAERIMALVRSGCRYRQIALVCPQMQTYRPMLSLVFHRCGIPIYISGTEDIMEKSVVTTVLSALEAACGALDQREVLLYLRSVLSPLTLDQCDRLENYVILWGIRGSKWQNKWDYHPNGLGGQWTEQSQQALEQLNQARELAVVPLVRLRRRLQEAQNLGQQVLGLYAFLEEIHLEERLSGLAEEMEHSGDNRSAQELNQLWEILVTAMEQLVDMLGDTVWDTDSFVRLFRLLLGQYDVGTIPPVLDAVIAGPVSAMRCQQEDHLFILGALEGSLPSYGGLPGVLTDGERNALRDLGVPLTGGSMDTLCKEFSEIYGVFCGAGERVSLSCPAGQPAFVYRRLAEITTPQTPESLLGAALWDPFEAGAYLAAHEQKQVAVELGVEQAYTQVWQQANFTPGSLSRQQVEALYGQRLLLSASQLDRQAECRLSYFLRYGLRAKERKEAVVDSAEFGTYVHHVLEVTCRAVEAKGGFRQTTLEQTLALARHFSQIYAQERFQELDSQRQRYLFQRNGKELELVVQELWEELSAIGFTPVAFELGFGVSGGLEPVPIPGKRMDAALRGFVDRVDVLDQDGCRYFRVVDYKTGKKEFDYCDVYNGVGLQLLLYLFALGRQDATLLGKDAIPAGVQYFPARVPMISADGRLQPEEAENKRAEEAKRHGLLLAEDAVIHGCAPAEDLRRLSCSYNKQGEPTGDVADRRQMKLLERYVFRVVGRLVDEIASGNVSPNPYTRGSAHNACAYCPYGAICRLDRDKQRRNYRAISAKTFWEMVEAEVKRNG